MKTKNFNKSTGLPRQAGQASKMLLALAIIVLVAIVIVYIVIKATEKPAAPTVPTTTTPIVNYEATLGDIRFTFQEAVDMGKVLLGSQSKNTQYQQKDLTTTEKFIAVTIGAKNQGKKNVPERVWDIGNIIDSDGRNYVPLDAYLSGPWLPDPNLCGALLKPEFTPISCTKIYEVSKVSKGLKIIVSANKKISATQYSTSSDKPDTALIDLIVTPK
ncbi:MAG: hypothetical protein AAB352_01980 [Patescibacteria group bacterium]